jgi:hypothetical protein
MASSVRLLNVFAHKFSKQNVLNSSLINSDLPLATLFLVDREFVDSDGTVPKENLCNCDGAIIEKLKIQKPQKNLHKKSDHSAKLESQT